MKMHMQLCRRSKCYSHASTQPHNKNTECVHNVVIIRSLKQIEQPEALV